MKQENAIEVNNITKKFKIFVDRGMTLKERMLFNNRRKYDYRQVLNGVSFEVKKGEAVGLIGQNGCGKSTILKLLSKIIYPDSGNISINGRVSSLIELGAGFHPDLSGRENIYINASIFGLSKREIDNRLSDIIGFSELEEYIDNPVRTYSSGMYMRLAFSVAINVDADVLLIDEILAVGDAGFQTKCFNKLKEIKAAGTTIVIVSHALGQIEQICERSYWIKDGIIAVQGTPRDVHPKYNGYMAEERIKIVNREQAEKKEDSGQQTENQDSSTNSKDMEENNNTGTANDNDENDRHHGNRDAYIKCVNILNSKNEKTVGLYTGEAITITFDYVMSKPVKNAVFGIAVFSVDGRHCYGTNTLIDQCPDVDITHDGTVKVEIDNMILLPGKYTLDVAITSADDTVADYYQKALEFEVFSVVKDIGVARIPHKWIVKN